MSRQLLRVGWYRLRRSFRRRWGGYLSVVLVIGLVGGVAMASMAGARRTQSSYPRFLAGTNPSDLIVTLSIQTAGPDDVANAADLATRMGRLPGVRHVARFVALDAAPLAPDGSPRLTGLGQVDRYGSVDGLYFSQDRLSVTRGRRADPARDDEMVMTAEAARILGLQLGESVPWGFATNAQLNGGGALEGVALARRLDIRLVGLVVFHDDIVKDDVDRFPTAMVFTPALTRSLPTDWPVGGTLFIYYGVQLDHRSRNVAAVEAAILGLPHPSAGLNFHLTSQVVAKAERAVEPESVALGVFGAIAALAALLLASLAISRLLRANDEDLRILRALGAGPLTTAGDDLMGLVPAVVLGAFLAAAVAVCLSPLFPLGPARPVDPAPGVAFDWTVLGAGTAALAAGLGAVAAVLAYRRAPHRVSDRSSAVATTSIATRLTARSPLGPPALVGVRFAVEPGRGRTAVPVRPALLGAAVTVLMVVATVTFGGSLHQLVTHPALYGWNWDYALAGSPWVPPQAQAALNNDPKVAGWTGLHTANLQVEGQDIPVLLGDIRAPIAPPILSGHGLDADNQVVLGPGTLARFHKHVGDTVTAGLGSPADGAFYVPPTRLVIVGTATLPALGQPIANQDHTSMGTGALLPFSFYPLALQQSLRGPGPDPTLSGPGLVLVRLRPGVSAVAGRADMQRIAAVADQAFAAVANGGGAGDAVAVQSVQHPAEIVNYRSLGTTPALLDAALAAGAVLGLGVTLASSVRRRRRDLAVLRTLGFTARQLAATVAWQASVVAVVGLVVGVPLGAAFGRWLWILFARQIYAVPQPAVPGLPVALVAVAAIALANLVAAPPARVAARTHPASLLRAE